MTSKPESEVPMLRSWTPVTTKVLERGGSSAWNVLDHAVETPLTFCEDLREELSAHWLSQVQPARTQGDVNANAILSLVQGMNGMHHALATSRGDKSIFISRTDRSQVDFGEGNPCLCYLIDAIQKTAQHTLLDMTVDPTLTSVQLAVYPGDGTSGYPRHCDRSGQQCTQESSSTSLERIITAVYYLTPSDWSPQLDGGCLRLFSEPNYDVVPYSNRLVLFRSDCVEHEVLPSLRRERMALTVWLYGRVHSPSSPTPNVHPRLPDRMDSNGGDPPAPPRLHGGSPPLPIATESDTDVHSTIFVSIAAYRDSELGPTLRSLMATARHPQRVFVGIVHQILEQEDESILKSLPTDEPWYDSRVTCLTMNARHARGPCYARDLCQRLYGDQDYVLQIDSHMRFRDNWDTYLIHQIQKCPVPQKSVLTAYPVGYKLPNEIPDETRGTLLVPWKFGEDGMLRQRGRLFRPRPSGDNIPCHLYAAGFNFAPASIIDECPYDARLQHLFFGEEISMAVRLFTHGYKLYAPPQTVCYHLWTRSHRPDPLVVTPDVQRERRTQQEASLAVVQQQLRGEGRGLGTERTAFEFAAALGVDFEMKSISKEGSLGGLPQEEFMDDKTTVSAPGSLERQLATLDSKTLEKISFFLGGMDS